MDSKYRVLSSVSRLYTDERPNDELVVTASKRARLWSLHEPRAVRAMTAYLPAKIAANYSQKRLDTFS